VGSKFVLDEVRSRFVYPKDKSFMVYFEWEAPPGAHALSGLWRDPGGRVVQISPDVKVESKSAELTCYWTYILDPQMRPGVWTLEVRIDGQPAGSHTFEIAGTTVPVAPEPAPKLPTVDEVFRKALPSLVWVRKINAHGQPVDTSIGFVVGKDRIVTAMQAVDGALKLEIEFSNGGKVQADALMAWSRPGDWVELAVNTNGLTPFSFGDPKGVAVGDRLTAFNVEGGAITIGGVDISGRRNVPGFGDRIQISPPLPLEAAGGPVLDPQGRVIGIMGGSVLPGLRYGGRKLISNPALRSNADSVNGITPLSSLPQPSADKSATFAELLASGVLTAPVSELDELIYAMPARDMTKSASDPLPRAITEFSVTDKTIWILSEWQRKGKESKGLVSTKVYDDQNRQRAEAPPKKLSLPYEPMRIGLPLVPAQLGPGMYRIDLLWNDQPVWRAFITIRN